MDVINYWDFCLLLGQLIVSSNWLGIIGHIIDCPRGTYFIKNLWFFSLSLSFLSLIPLFFHDCLTCIQLPALYVTLILNPYDVYYWPYYYLTLLHTYSLIINPYLKLILSTYHVLPPFYSQEEDRGEVICNSKIIQVQFKFNILNYLAVPCWTTSIC